MGHFWSNPTTDFQETPLEEEEPSLTTSPDITWLEVKWIDKEIYWYIAPSKALPCIMDSDEGLLRFWLRSFNWVAADMGLECLDRYTGLKIYHNTPLSTTTQAYLKGVMATAALVTWRHDPLCDIVFVPLRERDPVFE